jgi:hypothetical protein
VRRKRPLVTFFTRRRWAARTAAGRASISAPVDREPPALALVRFPSAGGRALKARHLGLQPSGLLKVPAASSDVRLGQLLLFPVEERDAGLPRVVRAVSRGYAALVPSIILPLGGRDPRQRFVSSPLPAFLLLNLPLDGRRLGPLRDPASPGAFAPPRASRPRSSRPASSPSAS